MRRASLLAIFLIGSVALASILAGEAVGQQPTPPPGYYDIPTGYDFPADKQTLEQYRASGNLTAQRLHGWKVFAGMTQRTPDNQFAIFETWYSEAETFETGATPQSSGPRRVVRRFKQPSQFGALPGDPAPQAAGTALMSEVLFNFPGYNHVRTNRLHSADKLDELLQTGAADPKIPNNRTIPPFPANAVVLKVVWWPVPKDQVIAMPIWDPESNPQLPGGNDMSTWKRVVAIDPTRTTIPPGETRTISFLNQQHPNSHVVSVNDFHYVRLSEQTAANAMQNNRLLQLVNGLFGRPLQADDYVVLAATHMTTKEIDDWVWATFWWHDRRDQGPFAADRPADVTGVWRNYLMSVSYDLNLPNQPDSTPHIAFNPWLEAGFRDGVVSNCMNCHNRAARPAVGFRPIMRGNPNLQGDAAFAPGHLRTDFLWSFPFNVP